MRPSASACRVSAGKRCGPAGMTMPPPASASKNSTMTRESNNVAPFSRISAGILPRGFCRRMESAGSVVSVPSTAILSEKPQSAAAIRTFRPKGEAGADFRIHIVPLRGSVEPESVAEEIAPKDLHDAPPRVALGQLAVFQVGQGGGALDQQDEVEGGRLEEQPAEVDALLEAPVRQQLFALQEGLEL